MLGMLALSMQSASFGEVRIQSALFREPAPRLRR